MNRDIIIAAGAGFASATLSVSILFGAGFGGFLLAYFALLPILIVGLSAGPASALVGALTGIVAVILISSPLQGLLYGLSIALPSWVIVRFALRQWQTKDGKTAWFPIGHLMAILAAIGAAMVFAAAVAHINHDGGFTGAIKGYLNTILDMRFQFSAPGNKTLLVDRIVPLFPALTIGSWFLMVIVNSVIAQTILAKTSNNLRPTPAYGRLQAPEWLYWAMIAPACVALVGSGDTEYTARNLTMILVMPFFLIGLGIVHVLAHRLTLPVMGLTIFYFMLTFLGWPALAVAGLGFFEPWINLRNKFSPPLTPPQEDD